MPDLLADSCAAFELDCLIQELPDQGTWIENVALKGPFMRRCMRRFDQPLLWIDVDGRIVAEPKLLYGMDADFAIYAVKREWNWKPLVRERMSLLKLGARAGPRWFLTGTMLVNRTAAARDLLERWAETSWPGRVITSSCCCRRSGACFPPSGRCGCRRATARFPGSDGTTGSP